MKCVSGLQYTTDLSTSTTSTADRAWRKSFAFAGWAFHPLVNPGSLAQIAGDGGCARSLADLTDGRNGNPG